MRRRGGDHGEKHRYKKHPGLILYRNVFMHTIEVRQNSKGLNIQNNETGLHNCNCLKTIEAAF